MKKTLIFAFTALFASPALASNFSYTNIDVSFRDADQVSLGYRYSW
jgi:hypothetical protein